MNGGRFGSFQALQKRSFAPSCSAAASTSVTSWR